MSLGAGSFTLDLAKLPARADALGITVATQTVNSAAIAVVYPSSGLGETRFARYVCAMTLYLPNGNTAGPQGQLVITGRRIIGMINRVPQSGQALNDPRLPLYLFAFDHADVFPIQATTNWRGKAAVATFGSAPARQPGFRLDVTTMIGLLRNDGAVAPCPMQNLLDRVGPSGMSELQDLA